jgi:uncharacterized protein YbjT (DUF2867 family)
MPIGLMLRALTCTLFMSGAVLAQGLSPPPEASSLQPSAQPAVEPPPGTPEGILVVGGTRRTGLEIVKLLRARGHTVAVMARHTSDVTALEALGIPVLRADALSSREVRAVIVPGRYRAIISTLGAAGKEPKPDFEGNRNLIDAAKAAGVKRFLLVTVIGAGNSSESPPMIARWFLKDVIALKSRAENYLRTSGLDYTIIRPGGLLDKDASGQAVLTEDPDTFSWIARTDLGQLVADALEDRKTVGHTYSAFDPTRERIWNTWSD